VDDDLPSIIVNPDLVRRVEQAITAERRAFALGSPRHRPDAAVLDVGAATAVYTGPGLFSNRVFGLGSDGAVPEAHLDRLEAFYAARGLDTRIEVPTTVERDLLAQLAARGYQLERFHDVHATHPPRPVRSARREDSPVEVLAVDATTADAWSTVLIDGFGYTEPDDRTAVDRWNRGLLATDGLHAFLARIDNRAVGGASILVTGTVGVLGGAATLPRWRRRGTQTALIAARLALAWRQGCDLAVVTADPGSTSGRNAQRAGFTLITVNAVLRRER
jgi:GNAT superfamily N-acetyltransferase